MPSLCSNFLNMQLRYLLSSPFSILLPISHLRRCIINSNLLRTPTSKISCPHLLDIRKIILVETTMLWCVNLHIQTVVIIWLPRLPALRWRLRPINPCRGWHLDLIKLLESSANRAGRQLASLEFLFGCYLLFLPGILH